ncbi:hypothetical protein AB0E62_00395 [Streptomyces sp. NPDC038707]|uniref:hypothetical protein n=1 Tax=Streptomyces sp. NPDC038707 TaxID=3154329 RepID=UPI0033DF428C
MAIASGDKGKGSGGDLAAIQQLLAAGGGASKASGKVYMGQVSGMYKREKDIPYLSPAAEAQLSKRKQDLWVTADEAAQDFYTWDTKTQSSFVAKAIVGGLLKLGDGPLEGGKLWQKLVKEAALYGKAGKKVSPFDLMASYVQAAGGAGSNAWTSAGVWAINTVTGERKYQGPGTYLGNGKAQVVDTRVDLTDPDTAKAVATKLFQDLMGRDPGSGELATFANALHTAEQSNPVVNTTTTQYDMDTGQQLSSDTATSGGVSAEGKALIGEQQVKGKKEYGAYQAATTYQNAFDALIFGGGS